jgi:valyl-tRNA synthetase
LQPYPEDADFPNDDEAEYEMAWVMQFILGIRQIRGEMDVSPGKAVPVLLQNASAADRKLALRHARLLERVGRVESITALGAADEAPASATALLGDLQLLVPMKGIIDVDAERKRLSKQLEKLQAEIQRARGKLGKDKFVNNAPADVVTKEKQRLADFERQVVQLEEQSTKLDSLN